MTLTDKTESPTSETPITPELLRLADQVGEFMQYWGFKRIHGQIWALVFLLEEPLDATTVTQALGVSKALVSLAIKDLLHHKVIEVCGKGHKRTVYFRSNPDIHSVILSVLESRERVLLNRVAQSVGKIKATRSKTGSPGVSEERLAELDHMVETARDLLELLIRARLEPKLARG